MAYWLFKSEPASWSWHDQIAKGDDGEGWDGVRNYQASNNMKAMRIGDRGFFYHSVKEKQIVGVVEVIKTYHSDPTDETGRFGMVTIKAVTSVKTAVTLAMIKQHPQLQDFALIRQSRLSIVPVSDAQWDIILTLADTTL